MNTIRKILDATGLVLDGASQALEREIQWTRAGWYSLDDDGVYREDTDSDSRDGSPGRATISRIRIQEGGTP